MKRKQQEEEDQEKLKKEFGDCENLPDDELSRY